MIKSVLQHIKQNRFVVFVRIVANMLAEARIYSKYMFSSSMKSDKDKLKSNISIEVHALEKGMSIGKGRMGFGKKKAFELIQKLEAYLKIGGDILFANQCCSLIQHYIDYNKEGKADMEDVENAFNKFCSEHPVSVLPSIGGVINFDHNEIKSLEKQPFESFSQSRYAIRDFGTEQISRENIERALKLCERTPSACNRQNQRIHIFLDKEQRERIFRLQGASRGFLEDMQGAILVCEDLRGYDFFESNLPFVDGGLYAMNLMYSLNYYDIATIPLTMGLKEKYVINILKEMGVGLNEVPVLLIGIGSYKDHWKAAQSHRNSWQMYTTIV